MNNKISKKEKGKRAEALAEKYFISKGFEIVERNFRTKTGEIDLILKRESLLVFVEVKSTFGSQNFISEEKVDRIKQKKILTSAKFFWLKNYQKFSKIREIRFDVVVINLKNGELKHYESAFSEEISFY
ncbi:MAG: YraN family protein [Thermodesulfobacteriaceae bacterium]|nr:YraN family protein [Thermodesulfobacteriaceae bacterium]MCX8041786.1 YraN family protein [Thermodesulfobacteriaceae bacterium]MDW8135205.1 YraN family protein [Thermodesulfobacterium sp.]